MNIGVLAVFSGIGFSIIIFWVLERTGALDWWDEKVVGGANCDASPLRCVLACLWVLIKFFTPFIIMFIVAVLFSAALCKVLGYLSLM